MSFRKTSNSGSARFNPFASRWDARTPSMEDADPPVLSKLKIDRYTGALDTDGDGVDDRVRVYLKPLDQHGRFMPVAGRATVQAVLIQDHPSSWPLRRSILPNSTPPSAAGSRESTTLCEIDLPSPLPASAKEATIKVTFTEATSGVKLTAEKPTRVTGAP